MLPIEPRGPYVLVKARKAEKIGSIYLPETHRDRHEKDIVTAELVAWGPLAWADEGGSQAWGVAEGDVVYFTRHVADLVKPASDGDPEWNWLLMRDEDVLARLPG